MARLGLATVSRPPASTVARALPRGDMAIAASFPPAALGQESIGRSVVM